MNFGKEFRERCIRRERNSGFSFFAENIIRNNICLLRSTNPITLTFSDSSEVAVGTGVELVGQVVELSPPFWQMISKQ